MSDSPGSANLVTVTEKAQEKLEGMLAGESDGGNLGLWLVIAGTRGPSYTYDMWFQAVDEAGPEHIVEETGDLRVVLQKSDIDKIAGATLDRNRNLLEEGFVFDNPNSPSPDIPMGNVELTGDVANRVTQVLDQRINPAIASHGGVAQLVAVENDTAYLRLGGGCQGCGLAAVTLSQGIEVAILEMVPEIKNVVDVTDHATGENPYYEDSKKSGPHHESSKK